MLGKIAILTQSLTDSPLKIGIQNIEHLQINLTYKYSFWQSASKGEANDVVPLHFRFPFLSNVIKNERQLFQAIAGAGIISCGILGSPWLGLAIQYIAFFSSMGISGKNRFMSAD